MNDVDFLGINSQVETVTTKLHKFIQITTFVS